MSEQEFLERVDELYKQYVSEGRGNVAAEIFKEDLYELVLLFKEGDS